jgi:hypothetical protein
LKNPGFIWNNRLEIKALVQVLDPMYLVTPDKGA